MPLEKWVGLRVAVESGHSTKLLPGQKRRYGPWWLFGSQFGCQLLWRRGLLRKAEKLDLFERAGSQNALDGCPNGRARGEGGMSVWAG